MAWFPSAEVGGGYCSIISHVPHTYLITRAHTFLCILLTQYSAEGQGFGDQLYPYAWYPRSGWKSATGRSPRHLGPPSCGVAGLTLGFLGFSGTPPQDMSHKSQMTHFENLLDANYKLSLWQICSTKLEPEGVSQSDWFKLRLLYKRCLLISLCRLVYVGCVHFDSRWSWTDGGGGGMKSKDKIVNKTRW